ncbi:hypothetical protein Chor_010361 [Crotalus horridus]
MTTVEEESDTVTVETVNSVTLTQDTQGNLILHCPQDEADEIDSEGSIGPPHKRLCLSSEDDQSVDGNTPCISVVAVPLSESDPSFEVTMTATTEVADHEVNEGTVTQIQARGIKDATEIIFEMSKDERKDFYRTIAWGLNRPLFAVYRRVLRMYDDRNHVGKYTPEEIEKLKDLRIKHGNDWATIGAALGRSASSVKDRCRLMKDTCNTGKWTEKEEKRLAEVVHELTSTEPGDTVTQGVSWAAVAERVGTRSEKQCRSKWLNYLNWKQSGGTEIAELDVSDENDINWDLLAEGWSSVRSPQWLRSKWWTVKRQIANHKEHVQIRVARLEESSVCSPASVASLQIPLQITHVSSADSPAASVDSETITLNSGTLQTFEILPSFHLQPTGTPGTYLLQTSSSQGLPLTLTTSPTVTLTAAAAPASPDQIIVHALSVGIKTVDHRDLGSGDDEASIQLAKEDKKGSLGVSLPPLQNTNHPFPQPEHLLNTTENVTVQCHTPSVVIRTVAAEDISPPISQAELSVDSGMQPVDLAGTPTSLETDSFPADLHPTKLSGEEPSAFSAVNSSKFGSRNSPELMGRAGVDVLNSDLKPEENPILQHHGENSHIIGSSLDSPSSEDSKGMENLVSCH